jgi:RNA polymerase sigma factor (sigma-70 family)
MTTTHANVVLRHVRALRTVAQASQEPDHQLLARFAQGHDREAFAVLMRRHGPLVLGVCRRILHNAHDADDAFQATFLVLARKADAIPWREDVGGWLYRVATRAALRARARAATRATYERQAGQRCATDPLTEVTGRELLSVLDEELQQLAERYRAPLVLCHLQGKTCDQAARVLGWSLRTLQRRLEQARRALRVRLARRGLELPSALLLAGLVHGAAAATVPAELAENTVRAVAEAASLRGPAGDLAASLLRGMAASRLRLVAAAVLLAGLTLLGVGAWGRAAASSDASAGLAAPRSAAPVPPPVARAQDKTPPAPLAAEKAPSRIVSGQVRDAAGKPVAGAEVAVLGWPLLVIRDRRLTPDRPLILGQTQADAQGRFRVTIPGVPPKLPTFSSKRLTRLEVLASAPGHGPGWQGLPLGGNPDAVEVRLREAQTVRGRVFDVQGQPIQGLRLSVTRLGKAVRATDQEIYVSLNYFEDGPGINPGFGLSGAGGKQQAAAVVGIQFEAAPVRLPGWPVAVTTDAEGRFELRGVVRGLGIGLQARDERFAFTELKVPPQDEEKPGEVRLVHDPAQVIEGTVLRADTGNPLPNAQVHVETLDASSGIGTRPVPADLFGCRLITGDLLGNAIGFVRISPVVSATVRTDVQGRFRIHPHRGESFSVRVAPADGEPFLTLERRLSWPRGAEKQELRLALSRGVLVRGRVLDEADGRGVAGSRVDYWQKDVRLPPEVQQPRPVLVGPDGAFQIVVPPGPGHLLFNGPHGRFQRIDIAADKLHDGDPGEDVKNQANERKTGLVYQPNAWRAVDLPAGAATQEVELALRRKRP